MQDFDAAGELPQRYLWISGGFSIMGVSGLIRVHKALRALGFRAVGYRQGL